MSLSKAYEPKAHEADIYKRWEDSGAFKPDSGRAGKSPFSIIMPPPNANGDLHAGHGMYTIDDIMIRYRRMQGHPTLWLPGTDHAGIETQVVFERKLAEEGKSRFDFSPSEFYDATMKFVKQNEHNMLNQMRSLGLSADWSRLKFTLDPDIIDIVYGTFKQLHDDGHIYRGSRIVNWCPRCNAAFADIEVKYREQVDPLYYLKYGPFVLATVRPETKFGDTAVAVNPKDERYAHLIGTEIEAEGLLGKFKLQVIGDDYVDPAFGTGVVKITPAHDPNDWEVGLRHGLEVKQAIGTDGRLTDLCGKYAGLTVKDARETVARDLEAAGLIDHIDHDYTHNVMIHDRCGTQMENLVTEQWWLKVDELKKPAIEAIKSGEIQIIPDSFKARALDWLENLRDWNISRQIWWGIRIPVYYNATKDTSLPPYIISTDENEAKQLYGAGGYEAETDTFDTWFSSGQWPFATLQATGDFDQFYPTSVMGTMRDILYLWVTRMIMFGIYRTGRIPFENVYLWGAVNDAHGKKMSKSKGNVINPLELTNKYGTDALRLALTIGVTPGTGGSLSFEKVESYRNFCNKLWNVARFILDKVPADYSPAPAAPRTLADHWILHQVAVATEQITADFEHYRFSEAGQAIYSLLWNDLADWYIEASKTEANIGVLIEALETILKLLHPFAPFVTEAIWQEMAWQKQNLIVSPWPETGSKFTQEAAEFELLKKFAIDIRHYKHVLGLVNLEMILRETSSSKLSAQGVWAVMAKLVGAKTVKWSKLKPENRSTIEIKHGEMIVWIEVEKGRLDEYRADLESTLTEKTDYLKKLEVQLKNDRLPEHIRAQIQARQDEAELLRSKLDEQIRQITKA